MPRKEYRPPDRPGGRRPRKPPDPEWLYSRQIAHMLEYLADMQVEARVYDQGAGVGIKRRADGSPSARAPRATVPVTYWATVYDDPVSQYGTTALRLEAYRERLRYLQSRGLYDGPTELTYTNRESTPDSGAPTGGAT